MKQAINTRTQEEYDALMRYYEGISITWCFSTPATENNIWEQFKEQTCVTVGSFLANVMEFDNIDYYKVNGYEIIPYPEFAKANIEPDYKAKYLEAREIKTECEKMYAQIKQAEERLAELRLKCKHGRTFEGNYSWRIGSISPAEICSDCGSLIQFKHEIP